MVITKMFGVTTSDGNTMLPFILLQGLRPNMEAYIKCLEEVVLLWVKKVAVERPYVWQQASAPCHTSRRTQSDRLQPP